MWLLTKPPSATLKSKYGFEPTPAWLEHLQKSCVRMGASGALVSADGLLMTNHHVGVDDLYKLSTPQRDLVRDGFYARSHDEELRCPDLEVQVLWSVEDVTERVAAAAAADMSAGEAYEAKRKAMTRIEQESKDSTGLDSEVVTLWHGARYHLYRYRRYTDIRLVFAPEKSIAFFGGDTDNFEYPRFDLDCCFFRIYEDGKPLKPEHYLKFSRQGATGGELLFVLGHPARTRRLVTVEHLKFLRDVEMPAVLNWLWRREVQLGVFCNRSEENLRIGENDYFGIQNSRKARTGMQQAMLDPQFMLRKEEAEAQLRAAAKTIEPWDRIAEAQRVYRTFFNRRNTLREGYPLESKLFEIARALVRLADELPKPSPERLREYRDSELESVYLWLYSPAPIYDELEIEGVASGLTLMAERFGADDALVVKALDGLSPQARAERLVRDCTLKEIDTRKRYVTEGKKAIDASEDPMIRFAVSIDAESRALRKRFEDEVEGVEQENYARIGAVQFALHGEDLYPDATGTLRFAFGVVKGYEENGKPVGPFTDFGGLYQRWETRGPHPPFDLPQRWLDRRDRLDLKIPLNFVLTADIIGGNSGSPIVNAKGEVTGLIFDGNLQSLVWDIAFDDRQGRAIAVDTRAIIEALRKIYDAEELADELTRE
ncbi:MAG: S46 family peptidase [Phycisphaerae bacterium]